MKDCDTMVVALRMLRDLVECDKHAEVCRKVGLVPPSPDVDEIEHMASHERAETIDPILEEMFDAADIAAEVILKIGTLNWVEAPNAVDIAQTKSIARAACVAVLCYLAEAGLVEVAK